MLDSALEVYEPATGQQISRDRVRLYNAACAISYVNGYPSRSDIMRANAPSRPAMGAHGALEGHMTKAG